MGDRIDPFRDFRVVLGTALAAVAGFAVVKTLSSRVSAANRDPGDYLPPEPPPPPPIIAVGTNTAGRSGTASKVKTKRSPARSLGGSRTRTRRTSGTKKS